MRYLLRLGVRPGGFAFGFASGFAIYGMYSTLRTYVPYSMYCIVLYCIVIILRFTYVELHTREIGIPCQPLVYAGIRWYTLLFMLFSLFSWGFFPLFHEITSTYRYLLVLLGVGKNILPGRTGATFGCSLANITIGRRSIETHRCKV